MVRPHELEDPVQGALGHSHLTVTRKQVQQQSSGLTLSSPGLFPMFLTQRGPLRGAMLVRTWDPSSAANVGPVISFAFLPPSPRSSSGLGPATTLSSSPRQPALLAKADRISPALREGLWIERSMGIGLAASEPLPFHQLKGELTARGGDNPEGVLGPENTSEGRDCCSPRKTQQLVQMAPNGSLLRGGDPQGSVTCKHPV